MKSRSHKCDLANIFSAFPFRKKSLLSYYVKFIAESSSMLASLLLPASPFHPCVPPLPKHLNFLCSSAPGIVSSTMRLQSPVLQWSSAPPFLFFLFWRSLLIATSPSSTEVLILRARQWKTALKPGGFCRLFHYPWVGLCTCGRPPFLLILFFNHVLFLFSLFYILRQSHLYEPPFLACCVLPVSIFHLLQHLKTEV